MADKPFDELTGAELQALRDREWTADEVCAAIEMALKARDMEATAALLHRLALIDPLKAEVIMLTVALTAITEEDK